jgi:hypothetical protein
VEDEMPAGRPSSYKPEYAAQAEKLCKLAATDIEIADFFEVDIRTIYRWKEAHPEFCHALKTGKELADERVERSLFARATGYEHDEVDIRVIGQEIVKTPIRKYYPPDTTAGIFWLKNRRKDQWREMKAVEVTGADGGALETKQTLDVSGLPIEVLTAIMAAKDATKPE